MRDAFGEKVSIAVKFVRAPGTVTVQPLVYSLDVLEPGRASRAPGERMLLKGYHDVRRCACGTAGGLYADSPATRVVKPASGVVDRGL